MLNFILKAIRWPIVLGFLLVSSKPEPKTVVYNYNFYDCRGKRG